jgi:hypothetical protein
LDSGDRRLQGRVESFQGVIEVYRDAVTIILRETFARYVPSIRWRLR